MIDHFDIELPESWAKSATCVQTRTVTTSSHQKSSDITVLEKSQSNSPWALQYGKIPFSLKPTINNTLLLEYILDYLLITYYEWKAQAY